MQLPPMLQGEQLTRLLQGAVVGFCLTLAVGFGFGGWQLASKAEKHTKDSVNSALVAALAPICAEKFQRAADAPATLIKLKATDSWKQDVFVRDGGWATFAGSSEPNSNVAEACARLLNELK